MDGAGWHRSGALNIPENLSILFLPPYSPELNPTENIWQFFRQTYLSNRVFKNWEAIVNACCDAWNRLTVEPGRIKSIATRKWARAIAFGNLRLESVNITRTVWLSRCDRDQVSMIFDLDATRQTQTRFPWRVKANPGPQRPQTRLARRHFDSP